MHAMPRPHALALALTLAMPSAGAFAAKSAYVVEARNDAVALTAPDGASATFDIAFCVLFRDGEVTPKLLPANKLGARYNVVTWPAAKAADAEIAQTRRNASEVGDGFDSSILDADAKGRTADAFSAAPRDCVEASSVQTVPGGGFQWRFPDRVGYRLSAALVPSMDATPPTLRYTLEAKRGGNYSVAFVGAPARSQASVDAIFQPLVWTEKRFPDRSYMTLAFQATLPSTLVEHDGRVEGVAVDPSEFPFDPLPLLQNSRFGIAVRNPDGQAQSMVFAPVMGAAGSHLTAGESFSFSLRPFVHKGTLTQAYEHTARTLYGFHDYRSNGLSSVNRTLERIVDYGMSHWSQFRKDEKGSSYETDAPGTVKNVSSLNPLDLALVTDDAAIWRDRVAPYIEYMVSREKYLFTINEKQKIQHPSYTLRGPAAPVSELAALHRIFNGASPAFLALAREEYGRSRVRNLDVNERGATWQNSLALYRASGEQPYLEAAKRGADAYIADRVAHPAATFAGVHGEEPFFWTQFVPDFPALLELYDTTGERRYLEAARSAARLFTQYVWFAPAIPDGDIRVNPTGWAPHYGYLAGKGHPPMRAAAEDAPAWRLSEIGLTPESSGTASGHRAIFMANWAPWLLRIAHATGDEFLHDVARSAVVGRYTNFPGYHINTARTTIYEKPDYPLQEPKALSVNSFHYNHVWPMASMLLDYLVSDAWARSDGAISFPSEYIEAYAYLQNRAYGGGTGRFFGHDDAVLWMPARLVEPDNIELNYISARSDDGARLYIALMNESDKPVESTLRIDTARVPGISGRSVQAPVVHGSDTTINVVDGVAHVRLPARGLLAFTIDGARIRPGLQATVMAASADRAWRTPTQRIDDPAARAMVLDYGPSMRSAFVFLEDGKRDYTKVSLRWSSGSKSGLVDDDAFPWEFTVPLGDDARKFEWTIEGIRPDGSIHRSQPGRLSR